MIKWYLERKWLPEILTFLLLCLTGVALDSAIQGVSTLAAATLITASVLFSRRWQWLAIALITAGTALELWLKLAPLTSGISAAVSLIFIAAFASALVRQIAVIATNALGIAVAYFATVADPARLLPFGIRLAADNSEALAFALTTICIVSINTLAWVFGRLTITKALHVGTDSDRAILVHRQAALGLEVAKQTERLGIARDLTDLLVQRISAVLSLSEGAKYVARADAETAVRSIDRIAESAASAQTELRRLYDLLHEDHELNAAPPSLAEIEDLVRSMREFGYNSSVTVDGEPFNIDEGAELCLFKIVYESLENVKKNAPKGTDVAVNFYWTTEGLQILIKDNGIETRRKQELSPEELLEGYTVQTDLAALVNSVEGATLSALRERASLYEGNIDVTEVPGVGFTVAAFFPHLREVAGV